MPTELIEDDQNGDSACSDTGGNVLSNSEKSDQEHDSIVPLEEESGNDELTIEGLIEQSPTEMIQALNTFRELPPVELGVFFTTYERCESFCNTYKALDLTQKLWSLAQFRTS